MGRPETFSTFGDLLKYLRIRAQLSQRDLAIAVGYSEAQISRLESNKRAPNQGVIQALFIPALRIEDEPELAARLLALAETVQDSRVLEYVPDLLHESASQLGIPKKRHNLPAELTSLVGREGDLAEIASLLDLTTTRLLTLTGSGGCGKTRLALRTAFNLVEHYPHGAWLVELAPLSEGSLVTQVVINMFGLLIDPNRLPIDTLVDFLNERECLLILDNCEHLIDAVSALVLTLLRACPRLTILATSREALDVPGEVIFHVPSLDVPPLDWDGAPEAFASSRLFMERAAIAQPDFVRLEIDASVLARICRRLDGIPLAIELAAARVSALPLSLIADRLEEGFAVLGSGGRGRVPRQATLQATVEWSYNLLTGAEQALLCRLPLFAGGWMLEQAEEVCTCSVVERDAVLDLLVALVSKSLVAAERLSDGAMRYRLHEIVRQYAYERLVKAGEEETLRHCFLDCYIHLAEQAEPELKGPRQMEWLDRLDQERDNFNQALTSLFHSRTRFQLSGSAVRWPFIGSTVIGETKAIAGLKLPWL